MDGRSDVCVVGDPNQSIHAFAGANPRFLREFADDYDGAVTVNLVRNYRSTPEILRVATHVLKPPRGERLRATRVSGDEPVVQAAGTVTNEAEGTANWILDRHDRGTPWNEIAVLYRINAQSPVLEAALDQRGIPYTVRGTERFYERGEVRQIVGILLRQAELDPDGDASALLEAGLAQVGWVAEAPAGQGRQRERWESLTALKQLFDEEQKQHDAWTAGEAGAWPVSYTHLRAHET